MANDEKCDLDPQTHGKIHLKPTIPTIISLKGNIFIELNVHSIVNQPIMETETILEIAAGAGGLALLIFLYIKYGR